MRVKNGDKTAWLTRRRQASSSSFGSWGSSCAAFSGLRAPMQTKWAATTLTVADKQTKEMTDHCPAIGPVVGHPVARYPVNRHRLDMGAQLPQDHHH